MFVSKNQLIIFIACVSFGGMFGFLFSCSFGIKSFIKSYMMKCLLDVVAFIVFTGVYISYAFVMNFPNLRLYMISGVLLGLTMYFKSFHILLAKNSKKFYNIIKRKRYKHKKAKDD